MLYTFHLLWIENWDHLFRARTFFYISRRNRFEGKKTRAHYTRIQHKTIYYVCYTIYSTLKGRHFKNHWRNKSDTITTMNQQQQQQQQLQTNKKNNNFNSTPNTCWIYYNYSFHFLCVSIGRSLISFVRFHSPHSLHTKHVIGACAWMFTRAHANTHAHTYFSLHLNIVTFAYQVITSILCVCFWIGRHFYG